ncbi:MAG: hypothetical protein ABIS27_13670 [Longimicrobiales bacterium]
MMQRKLFLLALLLVPARASSQTLFATRGLGVPLPATDARASALGGVGVGLRGYSFSMENPAEAAGLLRRGATATLMPSWNHVELDGESETIGGSRFPLIRVFYPVNPRVVASLGYGAYLDQTWSVRFTGQEVLGTDTVATSDVVRSNGGIAQLRFGGSWMATDRLALGLSIGMLSGNLDRSVRRTFSDSATFEPFESRLRWAYRAPQVAFGARWDPTNRTRISASLSMASKLKASAQDSVGEDREYGSSMKLTAGASAQVTPVLMATVGTSHQKYPEIASDPVVGSTGSTAGASTRSSSWLYGGGLEYSGLRSGNTVFPFRIGARYQQLPYAGAVEDAPTEFGIALGAGFELSSDIGFPQALFNVSLERAHRDGLTSALRGDGLQERFWRMNMSVALFGR